jgi:hypothetical protein
MKSVREQWWEAKWWIVAVVMLAAGLSGVLTYAFGWAGTAVGWAMSLWLGSRLGKYIAYL